MRTKALVCAAVLTAMGLATSQAQVFSVNIVGYINQPLTANQFSLLGNSLDNGTNDVVSIGAALPNKSSIQTWNGIGFTAASKTAGIWNTNIPLPVGTGFFVKPPSNFTNTIVGNVAIATGSSNSVVLTGGVQTLVTAVLPVAGSLTDSGVNTLNLGNVLPNKSTIQVYNGATASYQSASKTAGIWNTNLFIAVNQGFFVKPNSTTNWTQQLQ